MVRVAVFASGNGGNFESIVKTSREWEHSPCSIELLIVDKEKAFAIERAKKLGIPYYVVSLKECGSKKIYEEKIRFLINISHELRTPLTLIYASLKRILNKEVKQDELPEYLQGAFKQANQMKDIINIVLDARKMEVGQEVLHISSHPLHKWIQEVAETFQTASKAKEIEITYDFDDSIQSIAYDDTKCKVVLSNLIMNALKYSPNQTRIVIKTIRTNESIQVHVQD